jgi:hypothetical protein
MAGAYVDIVATAVEKQRLGYQAISLTHWDDNVEPQIAAGSKLESGSALYDFPALESITGLAGIANSSQIYIKTVVAGTAITAAGTITAPTWSTSKQGWYTGTDRVIGGMYKDSGGNYTKKWLYRANSGGIQTIKEYGDGTVEFLGNIVGTFTMPDNSVVDSKIAKVMTSGSHLIAAGATWTVPAGIYMMVPSVAANYSGPYLVVDGHQAPYGEAIFGGGMVISDGSNIQIFNNYTGGVSVTMYWRKLD